MGLSWHDTMQAQYAYMLFVRRSVCLLAYPAQVGDLLKRLKVGSREQRRTNPGTLGFPTPKLVAKFEWKMESPQRGQ